MVWRSDINILKQAGAVWPFFISLALHLLLFSIGNLPRAAKEPEFIVVALTPPQMIGGARLSPSKVPPSAAVSGTPSSGTASPASMPAAAKPSSATHETETSEGSGQENPQAVMAEKRPGIQLDHASDTGEIALAASGSGQTSGSAPLLVGAKETDGTSAGAGGISANRPVEGVFGAPDGPAFAEKVNPAYPCLARRLGKEGTVLLRLAIGEGGMVTGVEVVERAGHGFDEAAIAAVRASRFRPAKRHGIPVPCRVLLAIRFKLQG